MLSSMIGSGRSHRRWVRTFATVVDEQAAMRSCSRSRYGMPTAHHSSMLDLEIDWNILDSSAAAVQPTPAPAPLTATADDDLAVSEESRQLVEREREIAREHGFAHDDTKLFYAPWTKLWDIGQDAARGYAAEYAATPTIASAAELHGATIAAEKRQDRVITLRDWRLDTEGRLASTVHPDRVASLSDTAWTQLGARQAEIPVPQRPTDPGVVGKARAAALSAPRGNVNAWIAMVPSDVKARVRMLDGAPQIFAIVSAGSRGYTAYDSDAVLRDLARVLPDTRCTVEYDEATTRMRARAVLQAPIDIPAFSGVGRVHQAGVQFSTRDDGMMALTGRAFIVRIRCKNHSLVEEKQGEIRRKHTGSYAALREQISTLVGRMPEMIDALRSVWSRAAAEHYLDSETGKRLSAPEAIARLVVHGHIPTGGLEQKDAIAAYVAAWRAEDSPHSAAGVIMAIQRAAHETTWRTRWTDDQIEATASGLLYQHVYTLDAAESA
jgi:hypothetical protein